MVTDEPVIRPIGLVIIGDEILSGKRQDKHLANANELLKPRGLTVSWVRFLPDNEADLVANFKETFARNQVVFSFGGIGATPDDRTRQAAAKALALPIERHPEAVKEIEAQFGEEAYPQRIHMAEYPKGAKPIPNSYNRVPGFSIKEHYFMPGFPMMAAPMMEWVMNEYYPDWFVEPTVEKAIRLIDGQESEWVEFMQHFEARFPRLRLFSLPKIDEQDRRFIELGVEGTRELAEIGIAEIRAEAGARGQAYELMADRT